MRWDVANGDLQHRHTHIPTLWPAEGLGSVPCKTLVYKDRDGQNHRITNNKSLELLPPPISTFIEGNYTRIRCLFELLWCP